MKMLSACKLGYTLVELSRLSRARKMQIDDDTQIRNQYSIAAKKAAIFSTILGLSYPFGDSYDNHEDSKIIGYFDACFEGLSKNYLKAYKIGKTLGNITLNLLPDYLSFKTMGEPKYWMFLEMAEESFQSLEKQWHDLFSTSGDLSKLADVIKSIGKRPQGTESLYDLIIDLDKVSQDVFDKFEKAESQLKS